MAAISETIQSRINMKTLYSLIIGMAIGNLLIQAKDDYKEGKSILIVILDLLVVVALSVVWLIG